MQVAEEAKQAKDRRFSHAVYIEMNLCIYFHLLMHFNLSFFRI